VPTEVNAIRARLRPQERARLITQAATRLFAERGYESTSVADIAAAAGVTKPMVYRHFESKQDLCIRLLARYRDELIAAPLSQFEVGATDRLARMIDAWLSWVFSNPDGARLLFTPLRGDAQVEHAQEDLFRRQRDSQLALLREFAPGLSETDARPLAEMTRAAFAALALWWLDHPDEPKAVPGQALMTMALGIVTVASGPPADEGET
jgi:AcrR family transcriptional regulator